MIAALAAGGLGACAPAARLPAALFGLAALFWGFPMVKSIAMGQGNGMVMLALALGDLGDGPEAVGHWWASGSASPRS